MSSSEACVVSLTHSCVCTHLRSFLTICGNTGSNAGKCGVFCFCCDVIAVSFTDKTLETVFNLILYCSIYDAVVLLRTPQSTAALCGGTTLTRLNLIVCSNGQMIIMFWFIIIQIVF